MNKSNLERYRICPQRAKELTGVEAELYVFTFEQLREVVEKNNDKLRVWRFLHRVGIHKWRFDHDTGINRYYECEICGQRDVVYPFGAYQPIDRDWLARKNKAL